MNFVDQMKREVWLEQSPKRIVSLVPSLTELLVDLGLKEKLVGVTKFCVHPKGIKKGKTIVGGTKNFHFDKIKSLQPDLIIGNKEENYKEGVEELAKDFPVWLSDVTDMGDALVMIKSIGEITGAQIEAKKIIGAIMRELPNYYSKKGTAIYLIWKNPMIAVGRHTFIEVMMERAGFVNIVNKERYPQINEEEVKALDPDYILLSTEPFPFKEKHVKIFQREFPNAQIRLVDGEIFSWYGSRLLRAPDYFEKL